MIEKIYIADVGTEIILDLGADLTSAASPEISVKKPDGSVVSWPAEVVETTKLRHVLEAGDLDQAGVYHIQAVPNLSSWSGRGATVAVRVYENFG